MKARRSAQSLRRRKIFAWILRVLFYVASIAVILWAISFLMRLPYVSVRAISVSGNEVVSSDDVVARVEHMLAGSYAWIMPRNNVFFYPQEQIADDILEHFPRVESVVSGIGSEGVLSVTVTEREPFALWCEKDKCFFIDEYGFVFTEAPVFSDNVFLVFRGVLDVDDAVGREFLSKEQFQKLNQFVEWLALLQFFPEEIVFENDELFIIYTANGARLLLSLQDNYETTLGNLETVLQDSALMESKRADYRNLDYINLRFDTKVFYKLQE